MVGISFCFRRRLYEASLSEYRTASKRLGEVSDDDPDTLYSRRNSPVFDVLSKLLGELPMVFITTLFQSFSNLTLRVPLFLGILCLYRTG